MSLASGIATSSPSPTSTDRASARRGSINTPNCAIDERRGLSELRSVRDAIDLHPQPLARELRDFDGRPGRAVIAERSRVDGIHVLKLRHVDEKDAAPEDVLQIGASSAEDRLHVAQALFGLGGCGGADEPTRRRIGPDLSGHEDESVELHAR